MKRASTNTRWILLTGLLAVALTACDDNEGDALNGDFPLPTTDERDRESAGKADVIGAPIDQQYIYNGPLPALEDPQLIISLAGHTVRVHGRMPADWRRPLPFYATPTTGPDGQPEVDIVYPIATADVAGGSRDATVGDYFEIAGPVFTPSGIGGNDVPWGGFPYLEYDHDRSIALHGPISSIGTLWRLRRGKVSHGCNRMQGEHIVELAHLLGKPMDEPHAVSDGLRAFAPQGDFMVRVVEGFDRFGAEIVDVDYPAGPAFVRPSGQDVRVFDTWDARDFPRFVCAFDEDFEVGAHHCDRQAAGSHNPFRPEDVGIIQCPPGYAFEAIGDEGGGLCTDGVHAWGPFTATMVEDCLARGGGTACRSDRWGVGMARSTRGDGVCPRGASLDYVYTGYCVEGDHAFGPFPSELVARCEDRGGGQACRGARWNVGFLRSVMRSLDLSFE